MFFEFTGMSTTQMDPRNQKQAEGHVWAETGVGYAAVCVACKMLQSPCKPDQVVLQSCPHQNGPFVPPRVSSAMSMFWGDVHWEIYRN